MLFLYTAVAFILILQEKQEENELRALPPPSPAQITALSFTLMEAAKEQGISDNDFKIRQEIVFEMEKIIQQPLPGNLNYFLSLR